MDGCPWYVYILECRDGSLYTGITNDLQHRVSEHNAGRAAHWTCLRRPVILIHAEQHPGKSSARMREIEIKGWRREKKLALVSSDRNVLRRASPPRWQPAPVSFDS